MAAKGQTLPVGDSVMRQGLVMGAAENGTELPLATPDQALKKLDALLQQANDNDNDLLESAVNQLRAGLRQAAPELQAQTSGSASLADSSLSDADMLQYLKTQGNVASANSDSNQLAPADETMLLSNSSQQKLISYLERKTYIPEAQYSSYKQPALPDALSIQEVSEAVQLIRQLQAEMKQAGRSEIAELVNSVTKVEGADAPDVDNKTSLTEAGINTLISYMETLQSNSSAQPSADSEAFKMVSAEGLSSQEVVELEQQIGALLAKLEAAEPQLADNTADISLATDLSDGNSKVPLTETGINALISYLDKLQSSSALPSPAVSDATKAALTEGLSKQELVELAEQARALLVELDEVGQPQLADHSADISLATDLSDEKTKVPLTEAGINALISYLEKLQSSSAFPSPAVSDATKKALPEGLSKQELVELAEQARALLVELEEAGQAQMDALADDTADSNLADLEIAHVTGLSDEKSKAPLTETGINVLISYLDKLQSTSALQSQDSTGFLPPGLSEKLSTEDLKAVERLVQEILNDLKPGGALADMQAAAKPDRNTSHPAAEPAVVVSTLIRYLEQKLSALGGGEPGSVQPPLSNALSAVNTAEAASLVRQFWSEFESPRLAQMKSEGKSAVPVNTERPVIAPEPAVYQLSKERLAADVSDKGPVVSVTPEPMRRMLDTAINESRSMSVDPSMGEKLKMALAEERGSTSSLRPELSADAQRNASPLYQSTQAAQISPQLTQNLPDSLAQKMLNPEWSRALGERAVMMAQQGPRIAEVRLDPPELGSLRIRVQLHGSDQVSLSFNSPSAAVREVLEQSMPRLREMFAEQGLNLSDASVGEQSTQERTDKEQQGSGTNGFATIEGDDLGDSPLSRVGGRKIGLIDYYA